MRAGQYAVSAARASASGETGTDCWARNMATVNA